MVRRPRLTASEAESLLLKRGFQLVGTKASHRIYKKGKERFVIPFHSAKNLHPKIVKRRFEMIESID